MPPRRAEPSRAEHARDTRKLIVGRDITLSGEIVACDHLIVEGTVDASVRDCHRLEITENGLFRGKVEIAEAEIAGRVEGDIVVHGRLTVRASGHVQGKIQYGELSVEAGGRVDGHISGQPKPAKPEERAPLKVAPPDEPASIALSFSPAPSEDVAPAS
jgi:cytoskeletal protein CcmA (bactofilin family)